MTEIDLLDLLAADHRNLLSAGITTVVAEISQHLAVERELLYPLITRHCERGEEILERLRLTEHRLEDRMSELETGSTRAGRRTLDEAVEEHARQQEMLFPELRRSIPASALRAVLDTVPLSVGGAPTHAHPFLAEGGPAGEIAEDLASVTDRIRDRARLSDVFRHGSSTREPHPKV